MIQRRAVQGLRSRLLCLSLLVLGAGCTPLRGGWDVAALEARVPELAAVGPARLGDLAPHFLPQRGALTLFLCRWPTPGAIPVSLPEEASVGELELLRGALAAWAGAGLGLAFDEREHAEDGIEIRFAREGRGTEVPKGAGDTIADCALGRGSDDLQVEARLRYASVLLRRSHTDLLERRVPLSADELMGAALHELGHALGFPGHVAPGSSIMSATTGAVRMAGERVNAEEPFGDATLLALYSVPNGSVVGRVPLAPDTMTMFDRLASLAEGDGLDGPLTRVGDRSARIFWRNARGVPLSLRVRNWPDALGRSREIVFEANPPAQLRLETGHPHHNKPE